MNGPILLHERIDIGFARMTAILVSALSGKPAKVEDYMIRWGTRPAVQAQDPDTIASIFRAMATKNRRSTVGRNS